LALIWLPARLLAQCTPSVWCGFLWCSKVTKVARLLAAKACTVMALLDGGMLKRQIYVDAWLPGTILIGSGYSMVRSRSIFWFQRIFMSLRYWRLWHGSRIHLHHHVEGLPCVCDRIVDKFTGRAPRNNCSYCGKLVPNGREARIQPSIHESVSYRWGELIAPLS